MHSIHITAIPNYCIVNLVFAFPCWTLSDLALATT